MVLKFGSILQSVDFHRVLFNQNPKYDTRIKQKTFPSVSTILAREPMPLPRICLSLCTESVSHTARISSRKQR